MHENDKNTQRVQTQVYNKGSDLHCLQDQIKILHQQYHNRSYHSSNCDPSHSTDIDNFPILQSNKFKSHAQNFKKNLKSIRLESDGLASLEKMWNNIKVAFEVAFNTCISFKNMISLIMVIKPKSLMLSYFLRIPKNINKPEQPLGNLLMS
eukprot:9006042-Ditylum_brightwellii.AAC.1